MLPSLWVHDLTMSQHENRMVLETVNDEEIRWDVIEADSGFAPGLDGFPKRFFED